ncbi:LVIVD repeat-containing protein [Halosimplex halobium]|uniref:LVIVD repeat-containing protein n=1 Tax=Halosimplex halobium TaxID=3396618 RepID=UPI003F5538A7
MHRRQFLRAVAGTAALPTAALAARDGDARRAEPGASAVANATTTSDDAAATATPSGTPTPTPTDAVATPTSGYEPIGSVAVEGATETVLTPDGDTAFVAVGDGFAVLDLTDPAAPTVVASERDISPPGTNQTMGGVRDVKYDDGRLLVGGPAGYDPDSFYGVALFDVSDPTDPAFLRAYETAYPVHNCDLAGEYAYLTRSDRDANPLLVVDVGRDQPREVARWSVLDHDPVWESVPQQLRTLHDVFVRDGFAYLAYWDAGTWILDVSDPTDPGYVADVRERDPETLAELDGLAVAREYSEPPGNDHYAATDPDSSLLAVGKESWNSNFGKEGTTPGPDDPGGPSGVAIYDIADPRSPEHLSTIDPPPTADPNINGVRTTAHNFELAAGHCYSSWYRGGVAVHDLSDPADPERVRYFRRSSETSFWTAQLAAPGGAVVATSYYDPSDPDAPARVYTFPDVDRATPTPTPGRAGATTAPTGSGGRPATDGSGDGENAGDDGAGSDGGTDAVETEGATAGDGPGFGPAAALAGIGIGAWRLLDGSDEPGDEE